MATLKTSDEARIRDLMEDRVKLLATKDLEGLVASYAGDIVSFDAVDTLQNSGWDRAMRRAKEWLASYDGPIEYTLKDLNIVAGQDVAFCRCLSRVAGSLGDGRRINMWVRTTACFRKQDDEWLIVHEHTSVPFDGGSGRALLDLEP